MWPRARRGFCEVAEARGETRWSWGPPGGGKCWRRQAGLGGRADGERLLGNDGHARKDWRACGCSCGLGLFQGARVDCKRNAGPGLRDPRSESGAHRRCDYRGPWALCCTHLCRRVCVSACVHGWQVCKGTCVVPDPRGQSPATPSATDSHLRSPHPPGLCFLGRPFPWMLPYIHSLGPPLPRPLLLTPLLQQGQGRLCARPFCCSVSAPRSASVCWSWASMSCCWWPSA